jgi:multiple sugar transport system substrate-binding protein
VLGGVGIALSARCAHPEAAAALAMHIASPAIQSDVYARAGGQPAHAPAWDCTKLNAATRDFFTATRTSIEQAILRPQIPGHRCFQPRAGELVHRYLWSTEMTARECLSAFTYLVDTLLPEWVGGAVGAALRAHAPRAAH